MQKFMRSFVADFRKAVENSNYKDDIVSVVLFGSAARGSFVKGHSDVDIIVITKDGRSKEEIQDYMRSLVSRLNKKHNLFLEKTCSDEKKFNNAVLNTVLRMESFFLWGVPIYVLPQTEFDLVKKRVKDPKIWVLVEFLGSLNQFLASLKNTAVTIYGENLIKEIRDVNLSMFDRVKLTLQPYYLLFLSLLIVAFDARLAMRHAIKACLMESESDLMWLNEKIGSYQKDEHLYEKLFTGKDFEIRHLRKTMELRAHAHKMDVKKSQAFDYIVESYRFVASSHAALLSR